MDTRVDPWFRQDTYKGVTCLVCIEPRLRKIMFPKDVIAFQFFDKLMFKDEVTFLDEKVRRHEYEHYLQWKKGGRKYALRYTYYTLKLGYKKNPFELAADKAEKRPRKTKR